MTFQRLSENPRNEARAWNVPLGVPGFRYADLNRVRRLEALDGAFLAALRSENAALAAELEAYRAGTSLQKLDESRLLLRAAPFVERFLARLFGIAKEHDALCARVRGDEVLSQWKKNFVERPVFKDRPSEDDVEAMDVASPCDGTRTSWT
jgi:hypothetical protein